jgi:uncharacterized membrane protein
MPSSTPSRSFGPAEPRTDHISGVGIRRRREHVRIRRLGVLGDFVALIVWEVLASLYLAVDRFAAPHRFLLYTDFAQMYDMLNTRGKSKGALEVPARADTTFLDYLSIAFTIGASFATSGVTVTTTCLRWMVLCHGALCFYCNALVVGFAFQILQQLGTF